MFELERCLEIGLAEIARQALSGEPAAVVSGNQMTKQSSTGLAGAGPIPGFARRDLVFADIDRLDPAALLALRAVEDDFKPVVAIDQRDIIELVALRSVRTAKCE